MTWRDGARICLLPLMALGLLLGLVIGPFVIGIRAGIQIVDNFIEDLS